MKFLSWEYYGIEPRRIFVVAFLLAAVSGLALYLVTRGVLGGDSPEVSFFFAAIVVYLVLSLPRRLMESAALSQSREATTLAAACSATLEATHSRPRSVLLLESSEDNISSLLSSAKRRILLGEDVQGSLAAAGARAASRSANDVLSALATSEASLIIEGGEETQAITESSQLSEESKLPLFMAVAFFTPILLILFAVLTHQSAPGSFASLVIIQAVIMDLAFYVSSSEKDKLQ